MNRAAQRGHVEEGSARVAAFCSWPDCGAMVAVGARDIETASLAMRNHLAVVHDGKEAPPADV